MNKTLKKKIKSKIILLQILYASKFNNNCINNFNFLIKNYNESKIDICLLNIFITFFLKKTILEQIVKNSIKEIYKISLIDLIIIELNAYSIFFSYFINDNLIFFDSLYLVNLFSYKKNYKLIKKYTNKLIFSYALFLIVTK